MTLYKALGLPPSFRAKAMNPKFRRASDWLPTNQASVDKLAKLSLASSCWLTAGTVTVISADDRLHDLVYSPGENLAEMARA